MRSILKKSARIKILTVLAFTAAVFACNEIDKLLTFTVTDNATITIGSTMANLPVELPTPDITTSAHQEFENHNTRADLVKNVRLTRMNMEVVSPQGKSFSFLKSIEIHISTDGSDKVLLASQDNIPATATVVDLVTTNEKLDKYLKASSYKLHTTVVTRETLTQSVDVKLGLEFKVTADPL